MKRIFTIFRRILGYAVVSVGIAACYYGFFLTCGNGQQPSNLPLGDWYGAWVFGGMLIALLGKLILSPPTFVKPQVGEISMKRILTIARKILGIAVLSAGWVAVLCAYLESNQGWPNPVSGYGQQFYKLPMGEWYGVWFVGGVLIAFLGLLIYSPSTFVKQLRALTAPESATNLTQSS